MVAVPALITPTLATFGILIPFLVIPVLVILFIVWHVRKLNSIDRNLQDILETLKSTKE